MNDNYTQNLINRQNEIDIYYTNLLNKAFIETEKNTYSIISFMKLQILRRMLTNIFRGMSGMPIVIDPSFAKILSQAKKDVNSWGGEIYFVYLIIIKRYINVKTC